MTETSRSILIATFLLAFVGLQIVGMVFKTPLGGPSDERAHLSYIHDAMQPGAWLPNYRDGEIYLMEENINYLKHPALYYSALALVGRAAGLDVYDDLQVFRMINMLMILVGLALFIGFCRRMALGWLTTSVLTLSVTAVPMFSYYAGSVNNDNLAYAAVALVFFGLAHGVDGRPPCFGWVALGYTVAALTKVTAGAFLSFFLLFYLLLEWRRWPIFYRERAFWVSVLAAVSIIACYYLTIRWQYGSFLPSPRYLYTLTAPESVISFGEYFEEFRQKMVGRAGTVMAHVNFSPMMSQAAPAFYGMFVGPLLVWFCVRLIPGWRSRQPGRLPIADALLLGFLAVLGLHLSIGYEAYGNTGALGGMQPRYYLYLMPFVLTPAFFLLRRPEFDALLAVPLAGVVLVSFWGSVPFAQEKQYIEVISRHRPIVFDTDWPTEPYNLNLRMRSEVVGHVDDFWLRGGSVYARGWAYEAITDSPVNRVLLTLGNTIVGSRPSNVSRPDLRASTLSQNAEQTGFSFVVYGIPEGTDICELSLLVEFKDGSYGVLKAGACSPWSSQS